MFRKTILSLATVATLASAAMIPTQASAKWHPAYGWGIGAGVVGALAAGAIIANSQPAYAEPVYVEPACYITKRKVWVDGVGWVRQRVRVCE